MSTDFRETAEKHWEYNKGVLERAMIDQSLIPLIHYMYVEAMVHGHKHGLEESREC